MLQNNFKKPILFCLRNLPYLFDFSLKIELNSGKMGGLHVFLPQGHISGHFQLTTILVMLLNFEDMN